SASRQRDRTSAGPRRRRRDHPRAPAHRAARTRQAQPPKQKSLSRLAGSGWSRFRTTQRKPGARDQDKRWRVLTRKKSFASYALLLHWVRSVAPGGKTVNPVGRAHV